MRKQPRRLKTILNIRLATITVSILVLTVVGAFVLLLNIMTRNVRGMVQGELAYIGDLIDHVYEDEEAGYLWLNGYTLGEDSESFVYVTMDGMLINGSHMDELMEQGTVFLEDVGCELSQIQALEQSDKPAWITLPDGREYAVYAAYHEPGWDIVAGISKNYLYRGIPLIAVGVVGVFAVLFLALFLTISKFLDREVIKNIQRAELSLQKITQGDLDEQVQLTSSKELIGLSDGINQTVTSLKEAIARAQAAAWMERELSIASEIQLSAMPRECNHALQDDNRFSLYADIKTAKEVGGDFYDYFIIGENKLGFVIADVSGKGIPAAMFMMTAKTHIKLYMEQGGDLSEAFTSINEKLCEHNDVEMFVTVFAGVIDLNTRQLRYINAGHNPALLIQQGQPCWLKQKSGPLIGMIEEASYRELRLQLAPDDLLFLYTDGIPEAANPDKEMFGIKRLEEILLQNKTNTTQQLAKKVYAKVVEFEQGAQRADDITMLLLRVGGSNHE